MKILITGGGTGGHVYPGIAVAQEVMRRSAHNEVLFVGAKRGVETKLVPEEGFAIKTLNVTAIKGRGMRAKAASLLRLLSAMRESLGIIKTFAPDVVLGVGGYASGPVGLACAINGTPLCIAEQNAMPGLTNRWLAKVAKKIFLTTPDTHKMFSPAKSVITGNPIRPAFFEKPSLAATGKLNLLVIGGSQGARSINDALIEAVPGLNAMAESISLVHQTGNADLQRLRDSYSNATFPWEVEAFFTDMPQQLAKADFVISRSGAGAVAEICAVGRGALYVPFPHAADDHQTHNATAMVSLGAALIEKDDAITGNIIIETAQRFTHDRASLHSMGAKAKEMARPHAARDIVDQLNLIGQRAA